MCGVQAAMIAAAVVQSAGQLYQGQASAAASSYSAKINDRNAILADRRAKDAIERGQLEEERKLREGTFARKSQEAAFTAGGLDLAYGSPLDVITSTAMEYQMDASLIRTNAEREAEDYERQAWSFRSQGNADRAAASNAKTGSLFAAAGTALTGGAGVFKYNADQTVGVT